MSTYCRQWTIRNKLYRNRNRNNKHLFQENAFQGAAYEMAAILFCFNSSPLDAAYMRPWIVSALVQIMACRLYGAKPLSDPRLDHYQLDPWEQTSVKFLSKYKIFHSWRCIWKYRQPNGDYFDQEGDELRECCQVTRNSLYTCQAIKWASEWPPDSILFPGPMW